MNTFYFAFGSNLSREQMTRRCPGAVVVGSATLRHFALAFAGFSMTWNGAVATVVPRHGTKVPGIVYRLPTGDLERLDLFEGAPRVYTRQQRLVVERRTRVSRAAAVYELAAEGTPGEPSIEYVMTLVHAYRQLGFALDPLASALAKSREVSQ
jgi:gamma-glutamylcyclotransferase (GGCT)/AIG2-like uncharacterized protein YtfP